MGICKSKNEIKINPNKIVEKIKCDDGSLIDIPLEKSKIIKNQKENSICVIEVGNKRGTGFLCLLPDLNNESNRNKVLITCNHVLNENEIKIGSEILLKFNDDKIKKTLKIDSDRKKYTNESIDITIIEILKEDNRATFS